ncbi:MAG: hypothetical protein LBP62_06510 [Clostridiales bacterium]|jgi:hypothetical protein|nr:hypothetical protein [Clostridiales bacterium]
MSKKTKKELTETAAEDVCTHNECDTCADKFVCDYYISVFCQSSADGLDPYNDGYRDDAFGYNDGYGYGQGAYGGQLQQRQSGRFPAERREGALYDGQNQNVCRPDEIDRVQPQQQPQPQQQAQQQGGIAPGYGYGYAPGTPVNAPGGANGVQLSPIIIPVSFVPYTTQNQPLYQVETVMPEKEPIKHHGLSLFMLALSVLVFFAAAFPTISEYTGMNILGGLSTFIGIFAAAESGGFADIFASGNTTLVIGACLASVGVLTVFLTAVYNAFKYIVKSITGKLKKGPNKSNVLIFIGVIAIFVSVVILNVGDGQAVGDAVLSAFSNGAAGYKMNFGYYALFGISFLLMFTNAFIKTERYAEVEGALPDEE